MAVNTTTGSTDNHKSKCASVHTEYFSMNIVIGKGDGSETVTIQKEDKSVSLTVCEASDPSKSGDGNMRHIPIHAEGEGGGVC